MSRGFVILCARQVKKVEVGNVVVERENGHFIVTIEDEVYPVASRIWDAVSVLENESLANDIARAFGKTSISKKAVKKTLPDFNVRYFPTEAHYLLVVGDSSSHMDSESISQEA